MFVLSFFLFWSTLPIQTAQVHGTVRDAQNGEPLVRVAVKLVELDVRTETDAAGEFTLAGVAPGTYRLVLSTVGYRVLEKRVELKADTSSSFDMALSPDALAHKDTVQVHADPFDLDSGFGPASFTISGTEAKNLASVLADDPMRGAQSIPGVSSNDDFDSRFSLHGASYDRIGLYLDGILLHQPFHTVQGEGPSGSTAVFNGDVVGSMTLQSEGYGAQYEDRTAGALDVQTRDGSRDGFHTRVTISLPDAGWLGEGPLGRKHKGSWLISARKSYLQYFLNRLAQDMPSMAFGFSDTQAQLNYDLTSHNSVSLKIVDGISGLDRASGKQSLGLNAAMLAGYHYTLASMGYRYNPGNSFVVDSHAAFMRERYDDTNLLGQPLALGYYGEWAAKSDAAWAWGDNAKLQFGAVARPIRGAGFSNYYFNPLSFVSTESHRGNDALTGGYVQQSWTTFGNRLSLTAGGRWDRLNVSAISTFSPQASLAFQPWARTRLALSWGRYTQFPDIQELFVTYGNPRLLPARSDHHAITLEQRLGDLSRFRVEAFYRRDANLLFQPFMEARLVNGQIMPDFFQDPLQNSLSGYAKGVEAFLQRRTANGWTGWVSYTFSRTEMRDRLAGISFPSDQDQKHTFNSYLSYRLRPSVNLSAKFTYGSGFPVPGFFQMQGGNFFLAADRNGTRLPAYERLDLRMNKSKTLRRGKMTLYVEAVNILNHANYRFDSYDGYDSSTRLAYISLAKMFPILPSVGVAFEF